MTTTGSSARLRYFGSLLAQTLFLASGLGCGPGKMGGPDDETAESEADLVAKTYEMEDNASWSRTAGARWAGPPAGWDLYANGNVTTKVRHAFAAGASTIKVRASGTSAEGVWPQMAVSVEQAGGFEELKRVWVRPGTWQDYEFSFSTQRAASARIRVQFLNDEVVKGEDRNLRLDRLTVTGGAGERSPKTTPSPGLDGRMELDPAVWRLVIDDDFSGGFSSSLYNKFSGRQQGKAINNFQPDDVYVQDGVLVLRAQKRRNTASDGTVREYSGGGWSTKLAANEIAAETEILGTDVRGAMPYATTWPEEGQKVPFEWGAEDDFFEQKGSEPGAPFQTYHWWTAAGEHIADNKPSLSVPDAHRAYHAYGVVRVLGEVRFYLDGAFQKSHRDNFENPRMKVSMGIGSWGTPDGSRYPAYTKVRRVRVWVKR